MSKRYSLASYYLSISIPTEVANSFGADEITIGGEGSYLDTISIALSTDLYSTKGDATGSWIHTKNYNRTGTIQLTINQVSDAVARLKSLFNIYYSLDEEAEGLTLTLKSSLNNVAVAICNDCVITKIPDQSFGSETSTQQWTLNAGKITFVG